MNSLVTIIIPIYNVADYIEKCATSLFSQDYQNIEYIFVNDCTPDDSISILKKVISEYPHRQNNIKIINHNTNKGLGSARKTGLEASSGHYILHIDSDDWCELDMVSSLYNRASNDDADIVICDYYLNYFNEQKYIKQNFKPNNILGMTISGELENNCWNKLIKRSLYFDNNVYPPTHISMAEDRYLIIRLMSYACKVSYINKALMHYRQDNSNSLTFSYNNKSLEDFKTFVGETEVFLKHLNLYNKYKVQFYKMLASHIAFFLIYEDDYLNKNFPNAMKTKYIWSFEGSNFRKKLIKHLIMVSPPTLKNNFKKLYIDLRR